MRAPIVSLTLAPSTTTPPGRLRRILGIGFGLAVTIGSTIGVGILRAPGGVAGQLQTWGAILLIWLIGGVYTLLGAVCLTELGAMVPQAGGYYVYARRAFGDRVGFAVGWTDWITNCAVLAYVSLGMVEFLSDIFPAIAPYVRPLAIGLLVGFVVLQWAGIQISRRFQEWATALKCLAFLALIIAGLALAGRAPSSTAVLAAPSWKGLAGALQLVVITYAGWQSALYFTEEDRDTTRNLPRAIIGGLAFVIVVYLLVNVALLAILPIADLAQSSQPAALAAQRLIGGGRIITVLSVVSLLPILNAIMMVGTRVLFALGRDGMFWSRTAAVNVRGTPDVATVMTTLGAVALIAAFSFDRLVAIAAIFLAFNYAVCCVALIVLRVREPATPRPFRAWGYPGSAGIVVLGAVVFLAIGLWGDPVTTRIAVALAAVGVVADVVVHVIGRRAR